MSGSGLCAIPVSGLWVGREPGITILALLSLRRSYIPYSPAVVPLLPRWSSDTQPVQSIELTTPHTPTMPGTPVRPMLRAGDA